MTPSTPPTAAVTTLRVGAGEELAHPAEALARSRQLQRQGRLAGGVRVLVRGGDYLLSESLRFEAQDSGTAAAPVVWEVPRGERARLLGGPLLRDWQPLAEGSAHSRLPPAARHRVRQCDLASCGVGDAGRFASRGFGRPTTPSHGELFFGGRRMEVARWPDEGFAHLGPPGRPDPAGDGHGGQLGALDGGFHFAGDRLQRWRALNEVWVHGYWAWDWANSYERIAACDAATGLVRTAPPHGLYGFREGQRCYFLNVLEELDRPGEYFVDRDAGLLYFWPPDVPEAAEAAFSVLESPLVEVAGASYLQLRGLALAYGRGCGVHIGGGQAVTLAGCQVTCVGNHAVVVDGGQGHRVWGCELSRTGDGGVFLSGGDRRSLSPAGHEARNNHIHHVGEWSKCYQPAVRVSGVGQRVSHNLIHDGPHTAVLLTGNEHVIEYNHIHHVCQESGDVGAFYMGRDWTERGVVIRHNLFHHTHGVGMGSMAVYLDDCASGAVVFGNLFFGCTRAVMIGGGRNVRVDNNLFVDCEPAVIIDGRGLDPRPVWRDMVYLTMRQRLDDMRHREPRYAVRYPDLKELDRFYAGDGGVPPEGNLVVRNVSCGGDFLRVHWRAEPKMVAVQNNWVGQDPGFSDIEGLRRVEARRLAPADLALGADSPAWELGFQPIPLDQIGPCLDEVRRQLPEAAS